MAEAKDRAHCQGQAREWSSYPKFYDIVENSHIPTGCTVIEPYPFTEELGSCKDSNGYSGGYCSSTTGTWNSATCFRAVWREGVVAVNLPNDGSVCKSIYSEGAAPTNCPPGFSAHAEGNGNGKMAVNVDGSTIVHGDGDANNHCLVPNTETPYVPNVIVTHPFKKSIGACRDEYNNFGGSCRYENGRQGNTAEECYASVYWRSDVAAVEYTGDICDLIYRDHVAPTNCPAGGSARSGNTNQNMMGSIRGNGTLGVTCMIPDPSINTGTVEGILVRYNRHASGRETHIAQPVCIAEEEVTALEDVYFHMMGDEVNACPNGTTAVDLATCANLTGSDFGLTFSNPFTTEVDGLRPKGCYFFQDTTIESVDNNGIRFNMHSVGSPRGHHHPVCYTIKSFDDEVNCQPIDSDT